MSMGWAEPYGSQQAAYYNNASAWKVPPQGGNPFSRYAQPASAPQQFSFSTAQAPQQPKGVMTQLNQAIQPTGDISRINIGMQSPVNTSDIQQRQQEASKGQSDASKGESEASKANNKQNKTANGNKGDQDKPGKGLAEQVKQTQKEVREVNKEAMEAGGGETGKLSSVNSQLTQTGRHAQDADRSHQKGTKMAIMAGIMMVAVMNMKTIGKALETAGTAMNTAGQSMISTGQSMLSNPFTAAAGAALIAAGTALKVAGTAMKVAGKALQKAGAALQKTAQGIKKTGSNLVKKATKSLGKGTKTLGKARKTLTNVSKSSRQKIAEMAKKGKGGIQKGVSSMKEGGSRFVAKVRSSSAVQKVEKSAKAVSQYGRKQAGNLAKTKAGKAVLSKAPSSATKAKLIKGAKWGGGILAGGYVANKMLGGGQQQSAYTGSSVPKHEERFKTQEEFDHHYGFDKPLQVPDYESGYTSYYKSQGYYDSPGMGGQSGMQANAYNGNSLVAGNSDDMRKKRYNGNSLINNDSPLFSGTNALA
jgi:hypothetical protein